MDFWYDKHRNLSELTASIQFSLSILQEELASAPVVGYDEKKEPQMFATPRPNS